MWDIYKIRDTSTFDNINPCGALEHEFSARAEDEQSFHIGYSIRFGYVSLDQTLYIRGGYVCTIPYVEALIRVRGLVLSADKPA